MDLKKASEHSFLGLDSSQKKCFSASSPAAAFVSVPSGKTASYGGGSEKGPAAIYEASCQVELYDEVLGGETYRSFGGILDEAVAGAKNTPLNVLFSRLKNKVKKLISDGRFVVTLGGDHTSVIGAIAAHTEAYKDVTVLQFDAHADLRQTYEGSKWNHACAMARVYDFHKDIVQAGIRNMSAPEADFIREKSIPCFMAHVIKKDLEGFKDKLIKSLKKNVYITFDCDCLDPAIMPATGTPEPNGFTWEEIDGILASICAKRKIVGFDVNELAPIKGMHHPEFTAARLIYRLLGRIFQGIRPARRAR